MADSADHVQTDSSTAANRHSHRLLERLGDAMHAVLAKTGRGTTAAGGANAASMDEALLRSATCAELTVALARHPFALRFGNETSVAPRYDIHLVRDDRVVSRGSGTLLLGPAAAAASNFQHCERSGTAQTRSTEVFGFVNSDVLFSPVELADTLEALTTSFRRFLAVGPRWSVGGAAVTAAAFARSPPAQHVSSGSSSAATTGSDPLAWLRPWVEVRRRKLLSRTDTRDEARTDRLDAEDYFFWTPNFWSDPGARANNAALVRSHDAFGSNDKCNANGSGIPAFHVGRPAFDNWLVHTALHSAQPVVDVGRRLRPLHVEASRFDSRDDASNASTELVSFLAAFKMAPRPVAPHEGRRGTEPVPRPPARTYWDTSETQENYALGEGCGGWRHGMLDFVPLEFAAPPHLSRADSGGQAAAATHSRDDDEAWALQLRPSWRGMDVPSDGSPIGGGDRALASRKDTVEAYRKFVVPGGLHLNP
jgi:hypothetical protein